MANTRFRLSGTLLKLYKWEFWPFWVFYIPIYFYWFWLGIKARSLVFFSAANPLMELGGFSQYSKYNVLQKIPLQYRPKMLLLPTLAEIEDTAFDMLGSIEKAGLTFPLIVKPDKGERGKKVRRVKQLKELEEYLKHSPQETFILQELVELPIELGVMYYRPPIDNQAHISSIVQKHFLQVEGNGQDNVATLLKDDARNHLFITHIQENYPEKLELIPEKGEQLLLEPIGNHSRGTVFLDARHLANNTLLEVFDKLSRQIPGFYFGRYDLRCASLDALYKGEFKVLELNGANSEPAHIYDPKMPLIRAYRHLIRHWHALYRVSVQSHKLGNPYDAFVPSLHKLFQN